MNEFIEKLIARLEEYQLENAFEVNNGFIGVCKDIVNQLAEEHKGGWIPCSERLPEKQQQDYLICDDKGNVYSSAYYHNAWLVNVGTDEVVAWQPLPEPYKAEEAQWKQAMMNTFLARK